MLKGHRGGRAVWCQHGEGQPEVEGRARHGALHTQILGAMGPFTLRSWGQRRRRGAAGPRDVGMEHKHGAQVQGAGTSTMLFLPSIYT